MNAVASGVDAAAVVVAALVELELEPELPQPGLGTASDAAGQRTFQAGCPDQ
jgi:hypothetical protein